MISLLPNTTASDTHGAFALLALLSDAKAAKKRLEELVQHAKNAQDVLNNAQQVQIKADQTMADATKKMDDAAALQAKADAAHASLDSKAQNLQVTHANRMADFEAAVAKTKQALADREAAHAQKEATLKLGVAQLADNRAALQRSVDAHAAAVAAHDREHKELTGKLNDQLAEVRAKGNRLTQLETDLKEKLAKLKAIAG